MITQLMMKIVRFREPGNADLYDDTRNLTRDEMQSLWLTDEHLKNIWLQYRASGEASLASNPIRASRNKLFVIRLLREQQKQMISTGTIDWDALADLCLTTSSHRARVARLQGLKDARAVNMIKDEIDARQTLNSLRAKRRRFLHSGSRQLDRQLSFTLGDYV